MSVSLSAIEQAIKAAVQALGRTYIAEIKTYGGEFDEDGLPNVVRRLPAVWTTFEGSGTPEQFSAHKFKLPLVFVVLVGARSIRSEEATRHGAEANGEPGFEVSVQTDVLPSANAKWVVMGRTLNLSRSNGKTTTLKLKRQGDWAQPLIYKNPPKKSGDEFDYLDADGRGTYQ